MSEKEFNDILNEVRKKSASNKNAAALPLVTESKNVIETTDYSSYNEDYLNNFSSNNDRRRPRDEKPKKNGKKGSIIIAALLAVIIIAGVIIAVVVSHNGEKAVPEDKKANAVVETVVNPLTGESGYSKTAVGKRPVCVVVENEYSTEAVRPQWAINDADIVLEGESEYSTRLLLFWADYTDVPDMVGPVRSARPPFIMFSQLFDGVFVHAGLSATKDNYIGADTVFEQENVAHINLLNCQEDGVYFGRNNERNTSSEHTGYLNGANLPQLFEEKGINTDVNTSSFTQLSFNSEPKAVGEISAPDCAFKFSEGRCPKTASFSYDSTKHKYVTTDFDSEYGQSNVEFENLLFIFDETEYIVKENYKDGASETYCDYKLAGGRAVLVSEGTAAELTWGVTDGKLWLRTADGADASLNAGKTYIGYGSSNNGGAIDFSSTATDAEY